MIKDVECLEAERGGTALRLGMEADDRDAGGFRLGHGRAEGAGIDEVDRDRVDALIDQAVGAEIRMVDHVEELEVVQ